MRFPLKSVIGEISWNTSLRELQRNLKLKDISLQSMGNLEDKISEVIDICCLKDELEKQHEMREIDFDDNLKK